MTIYPAQDQRQPYSPYGYVMPERGYRVYTDIGATTPAVIYADANGSQGALVANSRLFTNQRGVLPRFHELTGVALYGKPDGFSGPIVTLQPDTESYAQTPVDTNTLVRKASMAVNVMDYGAKGDNTTDDTAAFTAALAAAGPGGRVYLPPNKRFYCATTINLNDGQFIEGHGYYVNRDSVTATGMDAGYLDTSMITGSVIRSGVTTGDAIYHVKPSIHAGGGIKSLALVGPGSGTSNGVRFGSATPRAVLAPVYRDVLVCNFATGLDMLHVNESEFTSVLIKGCTTAVSMDDDVNDATWLALNIQRCTNTIVMESGGTCYSNRFLGLICQNNTNGPVVRGFSHVFTAPYFELTGAGANMMDFQAAHHCHVISPQKQGAGTYTINIASGANFNQFDGLILSATMLITNSGTGSRFSGNLDNGSRITGANNRHAMNLNDATYEVPSITATSGSRPSIQNTNFLSRNGTGGQEIRQGSGSPEGVVTAPVGSLFLRSNPTDANTVIYVKATGAGNTGWVAK